MWRSDIKLAVASIRSAKWRSLLTMFGIIIGVASVVTTVSLGEGVKQQVVGQINHLGTDLLIIRPGKTVNRDPEGNITGINILASLGASTLTEEDVSIITQNPNIKVAVPYSYITGLAQVEERELSSGLIIATNDKIPEVLNQPIEFGGFFTIGDSTRHVAVVGKHVAEQLFQESVPVGKTFKIRGQDFIVRGVFEEFESNPINIGTDLNSAVFIPFLVGKELSGGQAPIFQVLAKPTEEASDVDKTIESLKQDLIEAHGGQEDFTILRQAETLAIASSILNLITQLIAGIAAISLFVGGIGVMNIMLVSVTERNREIGIRKAVGATNRQILGQFLVEAITISLMGGIIGVLVSILANFILRIFTNLEPVISLPIVLLAACSSLAVGVIFGVTPALKAARKDPIEALRYE